LRHLLGRLLAGGALVLVPSCPVLAQARATGADLKGVVRDATGAPLAASTVTISNPETNLSRAVTADEAGRFLAPALPPGLYTAVAAAPGFKSQKTDRVSLALGQSLEIEFVLPVAASDAVVVSASVPVVSTGHIEVGSVITQQQIQSLHQRTQLHQLLRHHSRRRAGPNAAAGNGRDERHFVDGTAGAVEQCHCRRSR
jgi:hypothetical protein